MNFKELTNQMVKQVEQAIETGEEWNVPWVTMSGGMPRNALTGDYYRGMNILTLWGAAHRNNFTSSYWVTYNQALKMNDSPRHRNTDGTPIHVRKGEKSTGFVVRWVSWLPKEYTKVNEGIVKDSKGNTMPEYQATRGTLKVFPVFNAAQVENIPERFLRNPKEFNWEESIVNMHEFLDNCNATVRHGGDMACYMKTIDEVHLPLKTQFEGEDDYLATSAHEHGHWTGHESRLDRDMKGSIGTVQYAKEELVAEMTSAFLCAMFNVKPRVKHAPYLKHYLQHLKSDSMALYKAASAAQKAVEYMQELQKAGDREAKKRIESGMELAS